MQQPELGQEPGTQSERPIWAGTQILLCLKVHFNWKLEWRAGHGLKPGHFYMRCEVASDGLIIIPNACPIKNFLGRKEKGREKGRKGG